MASEPDRTDLFLSYDRADAPVVEQLASMLADAGVRVWFDRWEVAPGGSWGDHLSQALVDSAAIGVCVGRRGLTRWQSYELDAALTRQEESGTQAIIPILLPGANASSLPRALSTLAVVDLSEGPTALSMQRLLAAVVSGRQAERAPSDEELGELLREAGDLEGARAAFERALVSSEESFGGTNPQVAEALNNLAVVLRAQGHLMRARELHERALWIYRQAFGNEHPATLTSLNNLAATLWAQGDLNGARSLQGETLEARRRVLGGAHPDTLRSMSNLAATLQAQGDLEGARSLQERALEQEKARGA